MKEKFTLEEQLSHYKVPAGKTNEDAWKELIGRIDNPNQGSRRVRIGWPLWTSAAAAVVVVLLLIFSQIDRTKSFTQEWHTKVTESQKVLLPDSSTIQLAPNSSVKINYRSDNSERLIALKGEAFFQVERGGDFMVEFTGGFVNVLGTEFSVSAYSEDFIQIACSEGLVKVNLNDQSYLLSEGQGIKLYNGTVTGPFSIDKELIKDQTEGTYYWNKIALDELLLLLGYRFDYRIVTGPELEERNFSGKIELDNLEQALEIISLAMNLEYSLDEQQRTIQFNEN
jgi:ferric-dicitrate binding protein FerR (iron transport regulator)